jgi:flagellar basal-body rod protein FlgB
MIFGTDNVYGKKMNIVEMGIDASIKRGRVIADNIANADTPFFKRSEVSFEAQMRRALNSEKKPKYPAVMTNERHIPFESVIDYRTVKPQISVEYDSIYRNDKNNVDIDKEAVDASKNALHYNALMEIYSRNIRILDIAMRAT